MEPGHLALMNYGEVPPCWHTRILLARVTDISWVILTPDYDIYAEELSIHNPDLIDFEYLGSNANPPARIPLAQVYGFQPMDPAALANFMRQGSIEANAIRALRGIPNGPVVPVPPAPAAPVAPPPSGVLAPQPPAVVAAPAAPAGAAAAVAGGKCWVCVEDAGGRKKGDIVVHDPGALPAGSLQLGDKALVPALDGSGSACYVKHVPVSEAPNYRLDDLRILPVHFDAQGIRRREFSQAVSMMLDGVPLGGGLQLEGPTSGLNVLKSLRDQSMTPTSMNSGWDQLTILKGIAVPMSMNACPESLKALWLLTSWTSWPYRGLSWFAGGCRSFGRLTGCLRPVLIIRLLITIWVGNIVEGPMVLTVTSLNTLLERCETMPQWWKRPGRRRRKPSCAARTQRKGEAATRNESCFGPCSGSRCGG